jgi:hypothetical protein
MGRSLDAGEVAIALFRGAFERWIADGDDRELRDALGRPEAFA